jgi:hypothetical protein
MRPEIHVTTRVLAGGRIEIESPDLMEGNVVEVTVKQTNGQDLMPATGGILEFLDSLPPDRRSREEWEEYDREFQKERDAWDR